VARRSFSPKSINRVVLATDGDFNVGTTSKGDLVRLIEREREHGIFLTVLGLGMGNYKDSTMEQLADKGNGNYAYLDSLAEARKVLVREAGSTLVTIAKDVKIQVEFNPARVRAFRLLGYENRMLRAEDFNDDRKDAGEIGAGHTVTALYEIVPAGAGAKTRLPGVDPLRYQTTRRLSGEANSRELLTLKLRYKQPLGINSRLLRTPVLDRGLPLSRSSNNFRFSAAVAAFGMLLRRSSHRADASFEMVRELARGARGQDPHGYRGEFLELVDRASRLAGARAQAD
jgi:Ca-activated chloride channel family protein